MEPEPSLVVAFAEILESLYIYNISDESRSISSESLYHLIETTDRVDRSTQPLECEVKILPVLVL